MKNVKYDCNFLILIVMSLCFFPFSIKTNMCSGNFNNINDPYAKRFVPDVVKNLNVKGV